MPSDSIDWSPMAEQAHQDVSAPSKDSFEEKQESGTHSLYTSEHDVSKEGV